jgi:hypothetical protein
MPVSSWLARYRARMATSDWAANYAGTLLAPLGDRWLHVQGVARQAQRVAAILPASDRDVLLAAAYLHDLGYAPPLVQTGLHPLDGARHLRALGHERLPAWSPITRAPGRRPRCAGSLPSWASSRMRRRPRRWR